MVVDSGHLVLLEEFLPRLSPHGISGHGFERLKNRIGSSIDYFLRTSFPFS